MKVRFIIATILSFQYFQLMAQELPVQQQYLLNPNLINPALTSHDGCTSFLLTDRHQWIGIQDAPNTQMLGMQKGFISKSNKIHGLGLNLYFDNNGAFRKGGGDILYSYHFIIDRRKKIKLGLGLSFSVFHNSIDETDFTTVFDPAVSGTVSQEIIPDAGAGIYLYTSKFFAGISGLKLLSLSGTIQETERHFYLNSGMLLAKANSPLKFEPSFMLKMTESLEKQIDINFRTIFYDKFWYTLSYRNNITKFPLQSISLTSVFGVSLGDFTIAYVFDLGLTGIQSYNYGSHEFMIRYKICRSDINDLNCPTYKDLIHRYRKR
ncbi:MAG: type IX secretion system membrane protein PorP/SprF [Bacteroidales bacterium]|nr:MAG: type IX secretion system membrane protein PorP/SprF [Bacteroidales bacterium]